MLQLFKYTLFLPLVFSYSILSAQCQGENKGSAFINEIGRIGGSQYIELVVVGSSNDPAETVDLSGWGIDDNNSTTPGEGLDPGHFILGDCFSAVPVGTIIVIYDDTAPDRIDPVNDGIPNSQGVYQLPLSSPCIIGCKSTPTLQNEHYNNIGCGGFKSWELMMDMDADGDAIQLLNANKRVVHALYWNVPFEGGVQMPASGSALDMTFIMHTGNNWNSAASFQNIPLGNPGYGNSTDNLALINGIAAATESASQVQLECYICEGDCVTIGPPNDPAMQYSWAPSSISNDPSLAQQQVCPDLTTTYTLSISNAQSEVVKTIKYQVFVKQGF